MKLLMLACVLVACGNDEDFAKRKAELDRQAGLDQKPVAAPMQTTATPAVVRPDARAPDPEPTTPAELDHALKQAMIDGRDKDALRYCDQSKLDDKSNPQTLLGCTLAACRANDSDAAHKYSKPLAKQYKDNAIKVCALSSIAL